MPSSVVHLALGGLLAAALLGSAFDRRAVLIVLGATAFPDLDAFVGLFISGAHRAAFHTLVLPIVIGGLIYLDERREEPWLRSRYGPNGVRTATVALLAFAVAGVGLDAFTGGANVFYPLVDQFVAIDGEALLSNQRGFVQTFIDLSSEEPAAGTGVGNTSSTHFDSGVDPVAGPEPENVERVFPIVRSGWQLLLVITGGVALAGRAWDER